ncbi:MAG: tetratricopeptide repeat protein [Paludibacteraceae bacterium]|nr:tetratricopeptide repeat protein [Paludibacteraceae bacterium]
MKLLVILLATIFAQANEQYAAGNYAEAAAMYQQVLAEQPSATAYYNLGNAYFKQGELSQSILAYERSLRLDPQNKDARYNLRFAQSRITDNITDNQAFFLSTFLSNVRNLLRQSTWTWLSLVSFVLCLAMALLFLLSSNTIAKKTGFSLAVILLVFALSSLAAAHSLDKRDTLRQEAIITQGIVTAKASPDRSGTELFTLHEGTKVRITETLNEWCNVTVGNYQGWIQSQNLERI